MTDLSSVVAELDSVTRQIADLRRDLADLEVALRNGSCLVAAALVATKKEREDPARLNVLADRAKELLRRLNESEVPF